MNTQVSEILAICSCMWGKETLLYPMSLTSPKVLIEFDVSNNTLDNFIVVKDKSAAQTKQMSFAVTGKDISWAGCHQRKEIACTALKQEFQEKGKVSWQITCFKNCPSIKEGKNSLD